MLITVKKEVEETIEVRTPCWMADQSGRHYHITEAGDLIYVGNGLIVLWDKDSFGIKEEIRKAFTVGHGCTEAQFKEALDKQLNNIQETVTS